MNPTRQFLEAGRPTRRERRHIAALARRRDYLVEELRVWDYPGLDYDRAEVAALDWALAVVAAVRKGERDAA